MGPNESDLSQAWPFPGSHHLHPCPRQGPLGQRSGSLSLLLGQFPVLAHYNWHFPENEQHHESSRELGYLLVQHLFVRAKIKNIYLAKPDVYIFIARKPVQTQLCAHTYLYQRFSKHAYAFFFILRECIKVF